MNITSIYLMLPKGVKQNPSFMYTIFMPIPNFLLKLARYLQIEWLTGGDCIAGMHEVVVTSRTMDAIRLASEQNRSLWRVSSTVVEI